LDIPHASSDAGGCVTVSIGVSCGLPGYTAVSAAELLRQADQALYRAKSEGRNRVRCFRGEATGSSEVVAFPAQLAINPMLRPLTEVKNRLLAPAR
jgi:predicted signal transduction protein with EAL and GGDEF domain